jgi:NADPH:quinone reductase-like Zn-dependent oxidoreductase
MQTKVLVAEQYGQPDVLKFTSFELPEQSPGDIRIAVRAAGVNPVDARRMTGELRHGSLPLFFGTEFAGTIVAVPDDHSPWHVGDEVLGSGGDFTHATLIDVPVANLVKRPPAVSWEVAGSLAGAAQTAVTILEDLGPISDLLVHGGAGGVGSLTIQLALQEGIDVVATCSEANQAYIRSLGATPVVYGAGLYERLMHVHSDHVDASIDMAGTEEALKVSLGQVKPDGVIGSITALPSPSKRVTQIWRRRNPDVVNRIVQAVAAGDIAWHVSSTYVFDMAPMAYAAILRQHTRGTSVLIF